MKKCWMIICLLCLAGCVGGPPKKFDIEVKNAEGESLGKITFDEQAKGVNLKGTLKGLPPGELAMHIHEKGKCEPPDFTSAGDDFNPLDKKHGLLKQKGPHAGDLPNIVANEDGEAKINAIARDVTLSESKASLYTKEGTSLIIHENADDGMTQPEGNAGDRIACGEITKDRKPANAKK